MESEKVCLKFTDLTDVPDCLNHEGHTLVINETCDGLMIGRTIKTEHVKADGNILSKSLNVIGDGQVNGNFVCRKVDSESIAVSTVLSCPQILSSAITTHDIKSESGEIKVLQSETIETVSVRAKSVVSDNVSVNNLRVQESIVLPLDTTATDLHSKTLSVEENAEISKLKSTFIDADILSVNSLQVNSINVETGCFKHLGGVNVDMETLKCDKLHIHTLQVDGCKEMPLVKDNFEGVLLPQLGSKYIWFGKLQSPTKVIEFKVKSVLDVLAEYVPVVNFHTYENPIRLAENFQVNTLVVPGDSPDSFIVKLMFNANLPATSKFILSVILQKI